ncbi:acetate/propionate family kinase [Acidiferrimicrobium sp. IK]|uniref:acetate/propionate family kinase n=1 Tax=Acidiferrimicrobium sp. IK TaxID=2871700 RepID=UPI0021CAFF7D|nr:acetate/propionate family kinase [Acidiferrimicrobium sp. IK]MCU4184455.1 acetate/propionate family kinase [Acidiferrimicrobium sp. IK]
MRILAVNAGSTSVKLRVVGAGGVEQSEDLGAPGEGLAAELDRFLERAGSLDAVAHRVVHGGARYREAVRIDDATRRALDEVTALAPLHNPPALAAIDACRRARPDIPAVACFDTAFHATLPPDAYTYALPREWTEQRGVRRFGFHGLSCAWAVRRLGEMLPASPRRVVVCHLGGGASVTAVADGCSVDTTMGFTPLAGLVMATRSGDVDPGVLLWMLRSGVSPAQLGDLLEHHSGLAGLSGQSGDMKSLLACRRDGDETAAGAVAVYLHRLRSAVGAMAAAAAGIDCLVFTGGVGEGAGEIRAETCGQLGWLGVALDRRANEAAGADDTVISPPGAAVTTVIVHAREELQMASEARHLLD